MPNDARAALTAFVRREIERFSGLKEDGGYNVRGFARSHKFTKAGEIKIIQRAEQGFDENKPNAADAPGPNNLTLGKLQIMADKLGVAPWQLIHPNFALDAEMKAVLLSPRAALVAERLERLTSDAQKDAAFAEILLACDRVEARFRRPAESPAAAPQNEPAPSQPAPSPTPTPEPSRSR